MGNSFLKKLAPYAAGALGSGIANQFSALKPFSAAIGAGAGALTNKDNRLQGAFEGFAGGGAGSAIGGGLMGMFGKQGGGAMSNAGAGAWQGLQDYGSSIPGMKGIGTQNPQGAFAKMFSPAQQTPASGMQGGIQTKGVTGSMGDPMRNKLQDYLKTNVPGTADMGITGSKPQSAFGAGFMPPQQQTQPGKSPMDIFKGMLPGMAVSGAGSVLFPGDDKVPDTSGYLNDLQNKMETNPNLLAASAYQTNVLNNAGPQDAKDTIALQLKDLEDKRADALRANEFQFNANVGGNYVGNSDFQRSTANINRDYDTTRAAMLAQSSAQTERLNMANKQAASAALSGLGESQIQFYAGLTEAKIQRLIAQFQLDEGRAQSLRDIAKYAGELMMQSQMPKEVKA